MMRIRSRSMENQKTHKMVWHQKNVYFIKTFFVYAKHQTFLQYLQSLKYLSRKGKNRIFEFKL